MRIADSELDAAAEAVARYTADFDRIKAGIKSRRARIAWERRYASYLAARARQEGRHERYAEGYDAGYSEGFDKGVSDPDW